MAKKRILISPEQQESQVGAFFRKLDIALCSEFIQEHLGSYLFIVDDYLPELNLLTRLQTKKSINPICINDVRGFFDENFLNNELIYSLLGTYFSEYRDYDLVDRFTKKNQNVYTLKIQDFLNIGSFTDTIVLDAYKNNFDCDMIRNYLNFAINYAFKTEEMNNHHSIEVSYAFNETGFALQILMSANKFDLEKEFSTKNKKFEIFFNGTNYFDVSYFRKKEKLLLSSLWFKEKNLQLFKSFFFSEIDGRFNLKDKKSNLISRLDAVTETFSHKSNITKAHTYSKLHLARKFANIIKIMRSREIDSPVAAILTPADIDNYLSRYPRHDATVAIDMEIKNFIIKLLNDENLSSNISQHIDKTALSSLDSFVDELQRIIGQKSLEDLNEIVSLVESTKNNECNFTMIEGWTEDSNKEDWFKKRASIIEKIKEQTYLIMKSGRNVVEEDIVNITAGQFNANPEEDRAIVKGLLEEAISTSFFRNEKLDDLLALQLLQKRPENDIDQKKLKLQLIGFKNSVAQMRSEIIKLRLEAEVSRKENCQDQIGKLPKQELGILKKAAISSIELIRENKRKELKQKHEFDKIIALKNKQNRYLEDSLNKLKSESSGDSNIEITKKLDEVKEENKKLKLLLEKSHLNIIPDSEIVNTEKSSSEKDQEIAKLKNEVQTAQLLADKLQRIMKVSENISSQEDVNLANSAASKAQFETLLSQSSNDSESSTFQTYKKEMEEKYKAQGIELKKTENKLKFTIAQLDEAHKRKSSDQSHGKSSDTYAKSMEAASNKLAAINIDLLEKKKEVIKLKQENTLLTSKVFELEKKLGINEKKVA